MTQSHGRFRRYRVRLYPSGSLFFMQAAMKRIDWAWAVIAVSVM